MKAVGGVISFGAVGIVLQGCGGGGDAPVKVECFHKQMDLVSQSIEATSVTNMVTKESMTQDGRGDEGVYEVSTEIKGTSKYKMDVKNFNGFFEVGGAMVVTAGDKEDDTKSWYRMVINADQQQSVIWSKIQLAAMRDAGYYESKCQILPMQLPPKETLKQMFAAYMVVLQKNLTCTGNDGTFDTFHGEADMQQTPLPTGADGNIQTGWQAVTDIQMDRDYLMGGISAIKGTMTEVDTRSSGVQKTTTKFDYTETTTKFEAGGPSSDDLDWSKWDVECKKAPTPPGPDGPGPHAMVKLAMDAKKFKPGALHFFSQFMNTPAVAHNKDKMVVI